MLWWNCLFSNTVQKQKGGGAAEQEVPAQSPYHQEED